MTGQKGKGGQRFFLTSITDEHLLSLDLLCSHFKTNIVSGLKDSQVKKILRKCGQNKYQPPKKIFFLDFSGSKERKEKHEIFSKAEWKRIFGQHLPGKVKVIRNGKRVNREAKHIVVGDLIDLDTNDVVPADIRLIWTKHLMVDNCLITGNNCEKRTHYLNDATEDPILSPNMIFACTRIISGHCLGIALRTGEDTVFGTLKNFAQKVKVRKKHHSTSSTSSDVSIASRLEHNNSIPDILCRAHKKENASSSFRKSSRKILTWKGSVASLLSSDSEINSTSDEEGSIHGNYRPRSVSDVLEYLG